MIASEEASSSAEECKPIPIDENAGEPKGFLKMMQHFSGIDNCTFNFYSSATFVCFYYTLLPNSISSPIDRD